MAVVTLTTDLGTRDFYLAALKGAIISQCQQYVPMVDVTHQISPFDIKEAAFTIRHAFKAFPKGTIHVVHVASSDGNGKLLLSVIDGHYFVTFDNGLLAIAFEKTPHETYEVNGELLEGSTLLYDKAIGAVVNLLLQEYRPSDFAQLTTETVHLRLLQPITNTATIRGTVVYIDNYGNAVTNITRKMYDEFAAGRPCSVHINVGSTKLISTNYNEVEEGDLVCLFNAAGYLEVAINKGRAEKLLGLKIDTPILVMAE